MRSTFRGPMVREMATRGLHCHMNIHISGRRFQPLMKAIGDTKERRVSLKDQSTGRINVTRYIEWTKGDSRCSRIARKGGSMAGARRNREKQQEHHRWLQVELVIRGARSSPCPTCNLSMSGGGNDMSLDVGIIRRARKCPSPVVRTVCDKAHET